jgi:parallel beta-helix repeat protein
VSRPLARGAIVLAALLVAAAAIIGVAVSGGQPGTSAAPAPVPRGVATGAPGRGQPVCGQAVLDAPWHYDGPAGTFRTSGRPAGLPTFGAAGTDFPGAQSIMVVPAGDNTAAALAGTYNVDHTVVYFEPGLHRIRDLMYTGHNSAYVGGYTARAGKAIIDGVDGATDGTGKGGSPLAYSTPSSGNNVYDTWMYLTVRNYAASENSAVLGNVNGGSVDNGDVYEYDTIGPNEFGYSGTNVAPRTGESSGGGYAIDAGSNTTITHDCLTRNAQGGFNIGTGVDITVAHDEISQNGLGEYPDTGSGPGTSPFACGCSGGGKIFFSLNAVVSMNYVHDNYNTGIWFDFDNSGATISGNYIDANWGAGIEYEASYNARISGNTLVDNGWAAHGPWPAGVGGKACFGGISCTGGGGPVTGAGGGNPYAAIDLSNSGGDPSLRQVTVPAALAPPGCGSPCAQESRYPGALLVQGNVLDDNFGGVKVYTDTNRYPGNIDSDSACSPPLGPLGQDNSATFYEQTMVLTTGADATLSGRTVRSAAGTRTLCDQYGQRAVSGGAPQAPSPGMAVYNLNSGAFLGTVTAAAGARSFTLSRSHARQAGVTLLVSAYGGCGPADYYGGGPGRPSGRPAARYWDNCIWGSRNVTVSGNAFVMNAGRVQGCTTGNMCGYMTAVAFNAGVPPLMQFFDAYSRYLPRASGGLGNAWSDNAYRWSGGGPGAWQFQAGSQGSGVTWQQWQAAPLGQDAGSSTG